MANTAKKVLELTGGKNARMVWAQQQEGCEDFASVIGDFKLLGFATDDDKDVRVIMDEVASYASPMFTNDGKQLVYTDNVNHNVHVVNFDGTDHRVLAPGYAVCVWTDPETDIEWVYIRPNTTKEWWSKSRPVIRHRLDDPSVRETVWTKRNVTMNWWQFSQDGTHLATCMAWPKCGMIDMSEGEFKQVDKGCWTSMSPDNSYRMWVFDINHRMVKLYDKNGNKLHDLWLNGHPDMKGWEIYHPRWSNHPRFVTVTAPFSRNDPGECPPDDKENRIPQGGYNVDFYLGRLNSEQTEADGWVRICENDKADFMGEAWIEDA